MSRFLRETYQSLSPYTPGEQLNDKKYIKLNTNESPFPPSPRVKAAIDNSVIDALNLYSDPEIKQLKAAIGKFYSRKTDEVFVGNGSDDVIAFAIMAFCGNGGELCCPNISYSFYPVYADIFKVDLTEISLNSDFTINVNDYIGINKNIIIANPNAPTGLCISVDEVEKIVKSNPDNVVIIDEAYMDFCKESCVELLDKYENLIVTQTFSKSRSLAGLRVGYAMASKQIIADMEKMKYSFNPYNMNTLSITAASAAIEDKEYYDKCNDEIIRVREETKLRLKELGFECLDSRSNFIFATNKKISAEKLYLLLKQRGVLIRYFDKPLINNYVRITIGSSEQMEKALSIMKDIIENPS